MVFTLSNKQMDLLEQSLVANFSVINPQGMPHMNPVWVVFHDGKIFFSTRRDRPMYKYLLNNDKVGLSIVHSQNMSYVSLYGRAEIYTRDDYGIFDYVLERIIRKYVPDLEKATKMVTKLKRDEKRILVEITPEKVFPSH